MTFEELYRRCWPQVFSICRRSTSSHHAAEELAQDTFERAWGALPALSDHTHIDAWVRTIAVRVCIDASRRRVVTIPIDDNVPVMIDLTVDDAPVLRAFDELPAEQRDAFHLHALEGWPRRRVAAHLGTTPGRVESLVRNARRRLREHVETVTTSR